MRDDRQRLLDILQAIERIERYAARGQEAFEQDELIQNWFVSNLQVIGEACRAMSKQLRDAHPEVPWQDIIGMRHILVHEYFGIQSRLVWSAVQQDIPPLKRQVQSMLTG